MDQELEYRNSRSEASIYLQNSNGAVHGVGHAILALAAAVVIGSGKIADAVLQSNREIARSNNKISVSIRSRH